MDKSTFVLTEDLGLILSNHMFSQSIIPVSRNPHLLPCVDTRYTHGEHTYMQAKYGCEKGWENRKICVERINQNKGCMEKPLGNPLFCDHAYRNTCVHVCFNRDALCVYIMLP